jgi:hypothetical protein
MKLVNKFIVLLWQTYSKQELLDMVVIDKPVIVEKKQKTSDRPQKKHTNSKQVAVKPKKAMLRKPKPLSIKKVAKWQEK